MENHSFSLPAGRESSAHHRHQASLEGVLDFSTPSLSVSEKDQAQEVIRALINHCEPLQSSKPYKKVTLMRLTYEQCRLVDLFLQQAFTYFDDIYRSSIHTAVQPSVKQGLARYTGFTSQSPAAQKREVEGAMDSFCGIIV